eukprot:15478152-Alexandrium_andersonii.AAC.2
MQVERLQCSWAARVLRPGSTLGASDSGKGMPAAPGRRRRRSKRTGHPPPQRRRSCLILWRAALERPRLRARTTRGLRWQGRCTQFPLGQPAASDQ